MHILLVDDEPLSLNSLTNLIETILGHKVTRAEKGTDALHLFEQKYYPMVLTDIRMPGMDGLELLRRLKALPHGKYADVVLMTGYGDMETAIRALRAGAYDYLNKPINVDELAAVIERVIDHQSLIQENYELTRHFNEKVQEVVRETETKLDWYKNAFSELVGIGKIGVFSDAMRRIVGMTERLHQDRSIPVLIEGETGTGKEIVARLIHYGKGTTAPFIPINCTAISPSLFESELFGYEGGAFTSSRSEGMIGKFELAQGGTLFLDEIGDLPLDLQPKLLRVIQESEIYRVGGIKPIKLNVRIIGATNHRLQELVEQNRFRHDLFYRLNVGRIHIPPLRDQQEAIIPLAQMFLEKFAAQKKRRFNSFEQPALDVLENHNWPGNIRELQNAIERVVLLYDDITVRKEYLDFFSDDGACAPRETHAGFDPARFKLPPDRLDLRELEDRILNEALRQFDGNKSRTAAYLGISRSTLKNWLNRVSEET